MLVRKPSGQTLETKTKIQPPSFHDYCLIVCLPCSLGFLAIYLACFTVLPPSALVRCCFLFCDFLFYALFSFMISCQLAVLILFFFVPSFCCLLSNPILMLFTRSFSLCISCFRATCFPPSLLFLLFCTPSLLTPLPAFSSSILLSSASFSVSYPFSLSWKLQLSFLSSLLIGDGGLLFSHLVDQHLRAFPWFPPRFIANHEVGIGALASRSCTPNYTRIKIILIQQENYTQGRHSSGLRHGPPGGQKHCWWDFNFVHMQKKYHPHHMCVKMDQMMAQSKNSNVEGKVLLHSRKLFAVQHQCISTYQNLSSTSTMSSTI